MGGAAQQLNNNNNIISSSSSFSFLTQGSQVEVSSDEDGFSGVWFVATVIHPPPSLSLSLSLSLSTSPNHPTRTKKKKIHHKDSNLVYVEYHNLVSEDGSSKPLREYADVSFVRPLPPPDDTATFNFQLNDVVDAFYRDGWWTGIISTVVDRSNFVVTFPNPPEEIQFHISDLRVHRKWVDGKWVRPENQRTAGLMFSIGKRVELSLEDNSPHFREAWFPATVIQDSGSGKFLVEYQRPGSNDEPVLHQITVDYLKLRPSPPHLRDKSFVLLEKVDAFYDFGWWSGVITKELADSRYIVFFKHTNMERELGRSDLRPHMEWKDGKWFNANQDTICNNANGTENAVPHGDSCSTKGDTEGRATHSLNLIGKPIEQTTPGADKQSSTEATIMKKIKETDLDSNDKHLQTSKKSKDGVVADDPSLSSPNVRPSDETTSPPVSQSGAANAEEAVISDQAFGKTENLSHGKKVRSKRGKGVEPNSPPIHSARKKGRLEDELKRPNASGQGATSDSAKKTAQGIVEKEHVTQEIHLPVVIGLQCNGMTVSRGKILQQLPKSEKTPNGTRGETQQTSVAVAPVTTVNTEGKQVENAETITPKRKRGRPPKLRPKSPDTSVAVNQQNGHIAPGTAAAVEGINRNEVGSPASERTEPMEGPVPEKEQVKPTGDHDTPKQNNASSTVKKTPVLSKENLPNQRSGKPLTAQRGKYTKGKRGKRRTISINTESSAQDPQSVSKEKAGNGLEKDSTTRNPELSVEKSMDAMSDDQPLSRWFEGMHSPTNVDGNASAMERPVEHSSEVNERQLEIVTLPPIAANGGMVSGDAQNLPFVRNTTLWQTIESMDAFRMIPQKPHFRPLDAVKESSREGLAIGHMVTFSSVVEKTFGLRFDDPRSAIEDCLETLVELESHGFDVKVIRDRLTGLLLIKDKQEELEEQAKGITDRMEEQNVEEGRMDEEIEEIDRQIKELQERRVKVLSKKESKGAEIAALEAAADGIKQGMKEARLEFDGLAAAPW